MARLRIQAVIDQYHLKRARVARRADLSETTLERWCHNPGDTHIYLDKLEAVAAAISQLILEERKQVVKVTVHDLIDVSED